MDSIAHLPPFNAEGALDPFPEWREPLPPYWLASPYLYSTEQLIESFALTHSRCLILEGFFRFRAKLRSLGFERGHHWIGGGFIEAEGPRPSPGPRKLDLATFLHRPFGVPDEFSALEAIRRHADLTDPVRADVAYHCDPMICPLDTSHPHHNDETCLAQAINWLVMHGGHAASRTGKGVLQIDFETVDEDAGARRSLERRFQALAGPSSHNPETLDKAEYVRVIP